MNDQATAMDSAEDQLVAATLDLTTFPFLKLPPEIRNMIYRYVLRLENPFDPDYYRMWCRQDRQKKGMIGPDTRLKVVRICKQIYREALPIYFQANTFKFPSTQTMWMYLKEIGQARRDLLTNVQFNFCGGHRLDAFAMLAECSNLEILHVSPRRTTMNGSKKATRSDLCTAIGMNRLLKVRGCKRVTVEYDSSFAIYGTYPEENIEKFRNLLSTELCKERKEKRKRKPKGQGKNALAAAAKAAKIKEEDNGNGSVV